MLKLLGLVIAAAAPTIPSGPALTDAIAAGDRALFATMFDGCDPERLRTMVTPDLEFYHDKGGLMVGADTFIADYAKSCEARKKSDAWRSRRELVPTSLEVWPVPGYGAIETGEHLFYERQGDGPEKLAGRARFAIVWALGADGQWRMGRALSFAHGPAR